MAVANAAVTATRTYAAGGSTSDILKNAAIEIAANYVGMSETGISSNATVNTVVELMLRGAANKSQGGESVGGSSDGNGGGLITDAIGWVSNSSAGNSAQKAKSSWSFQFTTSLKTTWAAGASASAAPNLIIDVSADGIFYQRSVTTGIGAATPEFSIVGELGLAFAPGDTPEARLGNFMGNGSDLNIGVGEVVLFGGNLLLIGNPSNPNNFDIVGGSFEIGVGVGITPITGGVEINTTHHSGPVNSIIDFRGN